MENKNKATVIYISHGGGPLPLLGDESHAEMVENLKTIAAVINKPDAIIVISAHWEERIPTITAGENPQLIYDYYGFPEESYKIKYPAPGRPALAQEIFNRLGSSGISSRLDNERGFDHGLFVPLKIMYPEAEIPCVQLSLVRGLDPASHLSVGKALSSLKNENLLIVGSGFSFHNLRAFFSPDTPESSSLNKAFNDWLVEVCSNKESTCGELERKLIDWESAPGARFCHPREEHLIPLHVCYGITGSPAKQVYELNIMRKIASAFVW